MLLSICGDFQTLLKNVQNILTLMKNFILLTFILGILKDRGIYVPNVGSLGKNRDFDVEIFECAMPYALRFMIDTDIRGTF